MQHPYPLVAPTATATASPTPTASATATPTPTASATATPTPTATATATPTPTATATATPTPTATATTTPTPTATATATPTPTATATATPTPTATATATPAPTPTAPVDMDDDGYPLADDCDDSNNQINPGVSEVPYDGVDNDCNGETPDDDLDGDGYVEAFDCNDNDPDIYPSHGCSVQTELTSSNFFGVAADGSIVVAEVVETDDFLIVYAQCLGADSLPLGAPKAVLTFEGDWYLYPVEVSLARTGVRSVISLVSAASGFSEYGWNAAILDDTCNVVAEVEQRGTADWSNWADSWGGLQVWDNGDFAVAQRGTFTEGSNSQGKRVAFYTSDGEYDGELVETDSSSSCGTGGFGLNVAIKRNEPGAGVFTCQEHTTPVMMRRFENYSWIESAINTGLDNSYHANHLPGVDDSGNVVVIGHHSSTGHWNANFYPGGTSDPTYVDLGTGSNKSDAFGNGKPPPEMQTNDGVFLIPSTVSGAGYRWYSASGSLISTSATTANFSPRVGLLYDGQGNNYLSSSQGIVVNQAEFN